MPAHLGWGSETLTAHLRKIRDTKYGIRDTGYGMRDTSALPVAALAALDAGEQEGRGAGQENSHPSAPLHSSLVTRHWSLKLYPDIALGMLREERTAAGRVWLLLRALDAPGRGMVSLDDARAALCGKESPLRLCGWRRLRQLLAEGEGVFWARERGRVDDGRRTTVHCPLPTAHSPLPTPHCPLPTAHRLRLFGPARVAAALGVRRLVGRPVGLPLSALLGPIGDARAHLYAAFHSGRARGMTNDELRVTNEEGALHSSLVTRHSSLGAPIARDTLAALSGVCARSQAAYERRAGVAARANIALGERVAASCPAGPAEQERAWGHGRALFRLKDYGGRHGRPGAVYLAWRLPNAYGLARGHQTCPKGRQKRINRRLADLFTKGMTGNGAGIEKRFFGTAAAAFKNYELRITNYEWKRRAARRGAAVHPATPVAPLPTTHYPLPTASCRPGDSCRPAAYWPLTTGHSPAGGGWGVWAVADRAVADRAVAGGAAGGMNPTAASRNLLKQVPGGPAWDANRLQPVLIGRGGFESA